ncbi:MAG: glycosyltransferase family 4 protein [Proteobacteria bacterium]|nr:glycosyltransferase family 4 protein [Pseudomonadota bacterium]
MKIAVFHYFITNNNPAGKCVIALLEGMATENDFTVFACEFDNPNPTKIRWVKIPSFHRPLFLLYLIFFIVAPVFYLKERLRGGFDKVIFTESRVPLKHISYAHYCHKAYLRNKWKENPSKGLRRFVKYLNHAFHAIGESWLYPKLSTIVAPSQGLKREIFNEYGIENVVVVPNPVNNEGMRIPVDFKKEKFRQSYGVRCSDLLMVFIALGDFERKGLNILFDAMSQVNDPRLKLLVVGGNKGAITSYTNLAKSIGIQDNVIFVGMQKDIRPYLWGSDLFVFPSLYEIFPLVVLEAAAAGLLLIVTNVYGVEEYIKNGVNGFIVDRTAHSVSSTLNQVLSLEKEEINKIGLQAQKDVRQYSLDAFVLNWEKVLSD